MRFDFLTLADAANNGPEGKLNVLGFGVRVLTLPQLPGASPLAIVGAVTADVAEAGEYDVEVRIEEPDGRSAEVAKARTSLKAKVTDERVPTGITFILGFVRPFRIEGKYIIRASVGDVVAEYPFVVRLSPRDAGDAKTGEPAPG